MRFWENSRAAKPSAPSDRLKLEDLQSEPFGSLVYQRVFEQVLAIRDPKVCRALLEETLKHLGFSEELSSAPEALKAMLVLFDTDLSPHNRFWAMFAQVVGQTFPDQAMCEPTDLLARQIHQLRYVFSAQQADWVRRHYGGNAQSDREALATYLAKADTRDSWLERLGVLPYEYELTYDLSESARFHNKRGKDNSALVRFPDCQELIHLKILINWHAEFILTSQGDFALVVDTDLPCQNGIINGASFNYSKGSGKGHLELDVMPVAVHDPRFRKKLTRHFRSPNARRLPFGPLWPESFYNPKGVYARSGNSCAQEVRKLARRFQYDIQQQKERV